MSVATAFAKPAAQDHKASHATAGPKEADRATQEPIVLVQLDFVSVDAHGLHMLGAEALRERVLNEGWHAPMTWVVVVDLPDA